MWDPWKTRKKRESLYFVTFFILYFSCSRIFGTVNPNSGHCMLWFESQNIAISFGVKQHHNIKGGQKGCCRPPCLLEGPPHMKQFLTYSHWRLPKFSEFFISLQFYKSGWHLKSSLFNVLLASKETSGRCCVVVHLMKSPECRSNKFKGKHSKWLTLFSLTLCISIG